MKNKVTRLKFTEAILNGNEITIKKAKELIDERRIGKDTDFSCPHHGCKAPLIFCYKSEKPKREPYFRTAKGDKSEHTCCKNSTIKPLPTEKPKKYKNRLKDNQSVVIFNPGLCEDSPARDNNAYDSAKDTYTSKRQNESDVTAPETDNNTTTTNMRRLFECRNGDNKIEFQGNVCEFEELFIDLSKKSAFDKEKPYFMYGKCDIKHNNEYYILFNFKQRHFIGGEEKRLKLLIRRINLDFNKYNEFRSKLININSVMLYIFGTVSLAKDRYHNSFISINVKLLNHIHFHSL